MQASLDSRSRAEFIQNFISLLNNKLLDLSKVKALAYNKKKNVNQKLKIFQGRAENIVGKGENAGHQHFLLFLQCFQKASF